MTQIASTRLRVAGVRTDRDVKRALQKLFDVFADHGLGQATFEITGDGAADLIIKHRGDGGGGPGCDRVRASRSRRLSAA